MHNTNPTDNEFLNRITEIIQENLSNEKFGVSELAQKIGMSRSNLLRKVQKNSNLSVSQFIRQLRLRNAMEILKSSSMTVSEVSYEVGFSSISYFIKCFHDFYGYPPGEVGRKANNNEETQPVEKKWRNRKKAIIISSTALVLIIIAFFAFYPFLKVEEKEFEKSIAVLPFRNDSDDSTNIHIINGLMEAILNNLQKIEDLRVISRTSVEKYRNNPKTISEIANELNVSYFVEGSGQKIGDKILLNVQLIEAQSDKHLWAEQYNRKVEDIFDLQMEIAKIIADEIQVIITPEEEERISKAPTNNLVAYDYFLRGQELLFQRKYESLKKAIGFFMQAIEHDNEFALAYANVAIAYYYLDIVKIEKQYSDEINTYSDKALLYDPKLANSLVAKALFYMHNQEYQKAEPYLEKALEYNPNSAWVINFLSDFYTNYIPNTEKYLEYALKGINLDIASKDSLSASYIYLHISNAFIQTGFVEEAEAYINKSLDYYPENLYSAYVKAYVLLAKNKDFKEAEKMIVEALRKDTTRLDVLQEAGKICYFQRNYKDAYKYYKKFLDFTKEKELDVFAGENGKIAVVLSALGKHEEAERAIQRFKLSLDNDKSIYKNLGLAAYYSYRDDKEKAIQNLKLFALENNYYYWIILFMNDEPLLDNISNLPEFKTISKEIENKFWKNHERIKASLKKKGLI